MPRLERLEAGAGRPRGARGCARTAGRGARGCERHRWERSAQGSSSKTGAGRSAAARSDAGQRELQLLPDATLVRAAQRSFLSILLLRDPVSPGPGRADVVPTSSAALHTLCGGACVALPVPGTPGLQTIPSDPTAGSGLLRLGGCGAPSDGAGRTQRGHRPGQEPRRRPASGGLAARADGATGLRPKPCTAQVLGIRGGRSRGWKIPTKPAQAAQQEQPGNGQTSADWRLEGCRPHGPSRSAGTQPAGTVLRPRG